MKFSLTLLAVLLRLSAVSAAAIPRRTSTSFAAATTASLPHHSVVGKTDLGGRYGFSNDSSCSPTKMNALKRDEKFVKIGFEVVSGLFTLVLAA